MSPVSPQATATIPATQKACSMPSPVPREAIALTGSRTMMPKISIGLMAVWPVICAAIAVVAQTPRIVRTLLTRLISTAYVRTKARSAGIEKARRGPIIVFNKEKIEKLGMKAFLAITQGSDREPKFIVMNYQPQ